MSTHLAQALILLPLLGAGLAFVVGRRNGVAFALADTATVAGLLTSIGLLVEQLTRATTQQVTTLGALPLGPALDAPLELRVTDTSALLAVVVLFVSFTVQLFSRWYLYSDPRYRSFASTVALFTAAMLLVVLSNDVFLTLAGWEVMGWCSYLLIGHESNLSGPRRAALKAFLVTRFADAPFFIGLAALAMGAHSTRITDVVHAWGAGEHGLLRLIALLGVICGVLGKSAQFPFTDWLPDAMECPAPASALIHAATMVAAGTVVLAQLTPLLALEETARLTLVVLAGLTSLVAAFSAFCQPDLKRLLAWSTISQVGIILLGIGALRPGDSADASLLHLIGHAAFKSLLFLMLGWLSVVIGSTLVSRMHGSIRRLPRTFVPVALGLFTMSGLPPAVAFVSKDAMLANAGRSEGAGHLEGLLGFVLLILIVAATAAYSARAWFILQHRTTLERRGERQVLTDSHTVREVDIVSLLRESPEVDEHGEDLADVEEYDEDDLLPRPGQFVRTLLLTLALGSLFAGLLAYTPLFDIDVRHVNLPLTAASVLLVLAAGLLVRLMSLRQLYGDAARRLPRHLPLAASRGFGLERIYTGLVATPVLALARGVRELDTRSDDAVHALAIGAGARSGDLLDRLHTRRASAGLLWVIVGVVVASILGVIWW